MNQKSVDTNLGEDGFPKDWNEPIAFRGFSRAMAQRLYVVRLTVNQSQRYIACATSQSGAARIYDLALWKLAAFLPGSLKPNYPEDFADITSTHVTNLCPALHELYNKFAHEAMLPPDHDEVALREKRLGAGLNSTRVKHETSTTEAERYYRAFKRSTEKLRIHLIRDLGRIQETRNNVDLRKLPALSQEFAAFREAVSALEEQSTALFHRLDAHEAFYVKLFSPQ